VSYTSEIASIGAAFILSYNKQKNATFILNKLILFFEAIFD